MFNVENEYDKYRKEADFIEIEGYDNNGEIIKDKKGFQLTILSILLFGTIGYFGYNYMQTPENLPKKAVMGVSRVVTETPLNRDEINQDEKEKKNINKEITNIVDDFVASETPTSYTSKKDISNKLNGMVDMFYNQEAIPAKLDNMVDDFYSEKPSSNENNRFVIIREGDTLAKISKKFYGNSMQYQKIIDANYRLKKSAKLYIGQKISVPY